MSTELQEMRYAAKIRRHSDIQAETERHLIAVKDIKRGYEDEMSRIEQREKYLPSSKDT